MKMEKNVQNLIDQFRLIAMRKWIPSVDKGLGSVGLTFERELNKVPDTMFFPDYLGVEIKCTTRFSRYPISLFSIAFDGPTFPEIARIVEMYGYFDRVYSDKKILVTSLSCYVRYLVNNKYQFQLEIDRGEEKLYLVVYDLSNSVIERRSFVYLKSIYNHLMLKLNKLAVIYASKKDIDGKKYFRYYKICVYKLRCFEVFLELLASGKISVYLEARVGRSGKYDGVYKNKSLVFKIKKDLIEELFVEIFEEDCDKNVCSYFES